MGAQLKANSAKLQEAEAYLGKHNDDLKFELAQAAVDVAGIADPTPISDVVGAGMSLYKGDFIGAGLSLISVIPYAGDALGKTAKGARAAKKINHLKKKIEAAVASINLFRKLARGNAAAAIRAKRKTEAAKQAVEAKLKKGCDPPANLYGTVTPKHGWSGERGNSDWMPSSNPEEFSPEKRKKTLEVTQGKPIRFNEGHPDFSPYVYVQRKSGQEITGKVEIEMTGNPTEDFKRANQAMKKMDPDWTQPEGWTWHHKEDTVTMELIPSKLNNSVPHTGGSSLVKDPEY